MQWNFESDQGPDFALAACFEGSGPVDYYRHTGPCVIGVEG